MSLETMQGTDPLCTESGPKPDTTPVADAGLDTSCPRCGSETVDGVHVCLRPYITDQQDGYTHREVIGGDRGLGWVETAVALQRESEAEFEARQARKRDAETKPFIEWDHQPQRWCRECGIYVERGEHVHDEYATPQPSITDEARRLVAGDRADAYGPADESFKKIGRLWGALLGIEDIEPRKVALMLTALKLSRESYKADRDNRTDAIGYVLLADRLAQGD